MKTAIVWFLIRVLNVTEKEVHAMAGELRVGLLELLRKAQMQEDTDFLREGVRYCLRR